MMPRFEPGKTYYTYSEFDGYESRDLIKVIKRTEKFITYYSPLSGKTYRTKVLPYYLDHEAVRQPDYDVTFSAERVME